MSSCNTANKDSVVAISDNGQITASSSSGIANVLVTAHEDFGFNQTILVQIEVEYIFLSLHSFFCIASNDGLLNIYWQNLIG